MRTRMGLDKRMLQTLILTGGFLLAVLAGAVFADSLKVVESEFFWSSSNLTEVNPIQGRQIKKSAGKKTGLLGDLAYKTHFDLYGAPPPLSFLIPLKEGGDPLAKIENGYLLFRKTGKKIPLSTSLLPSGANPAPPYLLSLPKINRILVVYPYYLYQDKENKFMTEVYSDQGTLLSAWDSLPTHVSGNNPYLLVSPERSGCCESLKWSIRFYNLRRNSVSEYSCPEGFCGDVLLTRLGDQGPFFIAQEIVGRVSEVGASMQVNFFIVGNEGDLSASGKILLAVHEPHIDKRKAESLSPFAVSNLISIQPLPERDSWILSFGRQGKKTALNLASVYQGMTPCVAFLLSKDPSLYPKGGEVKITGKMLGSLPLLLVTEPGQYRFSNPFGVEETDKEITGDFLSDQINMMMF
jgi:hypothetical protein